jgi:hypothetical protein
MKSYAQMNKKQLLMARKALNSFDITNKFRKIKFPVLVLVGDGFGEFDFANG